MITLLTLVAGAQQQPAPQPPPQQQPFTLQVNTQLVVETAIVNDKDGGKALLLIGQGPRLQPVIERGLAARELRNIMH